MVLDKLRVSICCLACLLPALTLSCGSPATAVQPLPTAKIPAPTANVEAVKFDLGPLTVVQQEVEAGTVAQAVVSIKNVGGTRNVYVGTLKVDGQEYGRQDITLSPGQAGTLIFQISNLSIGTHKLTMAGLEGDVSVYKIERHILTNNQVYLPHYTDLDFTPPPPIPYTSTNSFTPPEAPFFITRIDFRYPYPQSFKILDANGRLLYSADEADNESAFVPNVQVNGLFSIQMQTNQPVADIRLQYSGLYSSIYVIKFFWPEVSTLEGFQKRFAP